VVSHDVMRASVVGYNLSSNFSAILGSRAAINSVLLELRDLYSNSSKIIGLTFWGGITT